MAKIARNVKYINGKYIGQIYVRRVVKKCSDQGKPYVGESTDMGNRDSNWFKKNSTSYGGKKLQDARKMYSDLHNDWGTSILETLYADTKEGLSDLIDEREDYWIDELDAIANGFNTYKNSERHFSDEHCKHISEGHRNYQLKSTKEILREKGKSHVVTDETRAKISAGNTGKVHTPQQKAAQSARMAGVEPVAATEGAKKWVKENGGGYWSNHEIPQETKDKMKAYHQLHGIPVIATFPDGTEHDYPTMQDAANGASEFIGHKVNVGSVANCLKNNGKTKDKFKFRKK